MGGLRGVDRRRIQQVRTSHVEASRSVQLRRCHYHLQMKGHYDAHNEIKLRLDASGKGPGDGVEFQQSRWPPKNRDHTVATDPSSMLHLFLYSIAQDPHAQTQLQIDFEELPPHCSLLHRQRCAPRPPTTCFPRTVQIRARNRRLNSTVTHHNRSCHVPMPKIQSCALAGDTVVGWANYCERDDTTMNHAMWPTMALDSFITVQALSRLHRILVLDEILRGKQPELSVLNTSITPSGSASRLKRGDLTALKVMPSGKPGEDPPTLTRVVFPRCDQGNIGIPLAPTRMKRRTGRAIVFMARVFPGHNELVGK